jgi:hypothetical protein
MLTAPDLVLPHMSSAARMNTHVQVIVFQTVQIVVHGWIRTCVVIARINFNLDLLAHSFSRTVGRIHDFAILVYTT